MSDRNELLIIELLCYLVQNHEPGEHDERAKEIQALVKDELNAIPHQGTTSQLYPVPTTRHGSWISSAKMKKLNRDYRQATQENFDNDMFEREWAEKYGEG